MIRRIGLALIVLAAAGAAAPAGASETSPLPPPRPGAGTAAGPAAASTVPLPPPARRASLATGSPGPHRDLAPPAIPSAASIPDSGAGGAAVEPGAVPLPPPAPRRAAPEPGSPDPVAPPEAAIPASAAGGVAPATAPHPPGRVESTERAPDPAATPAAVPEIVAVMATPDIVPGIPAPGAALPPAGVFCRDPRLVGTVLPTFTGRVAGCGIPGPVEITAAAGVGFSREAKVDCTTARALADWIMGVVQPAAREVYGSRVTGIDVIGSYSCRTRNNAPGARISEHAKGRAVDIGAFTLADGQRIAVRTGWPGGETRRFLRRIWEGACGAFGTVLGPDSDRYHRDHFHLDTASYRTGPYCR